MNRIVWLGALLAIAVAGCQELGLRAPFSTIRSQDPDEETTADEEFTTSVSTPMVGDYVSVAGLNPIELYGVGLITNLDGTGGDPPPSTYRTVLLEQMKKRQVKNPNTWLQSPNTALVVVKAYLPPLVRKGDTFDVEVMLPPGSEATSLNGGWLMETYLSEQAVIPGQGVLKGHVYAKASGPVLLSTGQGNKASLAGVLRRGRVLGGGMAIREDRHLSLYLRNDFRIGRNSQRIADAIGKRFFDYSRHGQRVPLAEPKTDQKIVLKVLTRYRDNYPRYLQVIRHIPFRETPVAQRVRMQKLAETLSNPVTSEKASLELEAIGHEAVPTLRTGLRSPLLEVRFHAAMSLAYLGETDGLKVLQEAAREEPAFRVYAFAAMAAIDDAESHVLLRELLSENSTETRYGAFRALTTLDPNDPFIRGEKLNDEFMLHVLHTEGQPLIHLTNHRKAELVLFGADQTFLTPLAARAGKILVTAKAGGSTVSISRYEVGKPEQHAEVSTRVADVIAKVAEFGATYPDIAGLLVQAERQGNLTGTIAIDALPRAGRVYYRPADKDGRKTKARVGRKTQAPNLYSIDEDAKDPNAPKAPEVEEEVEPDVGPIDLTSAEEGAGDDVGEASAADMRAEPAEPEKESVIKRVGFFRWFQRKGKEPALEPDEEAEE